jgi:hypothetical protein
VASRATASQFSEHSARIRIAPAWSLLWGSAVGAPRARARWAQPAFVGFRVEAGFAFRGRRVTVVPAMPPFTSKHSVRSLGEGTPALLALALTAGANKSIDTDVLSAGFASLLAAGHLQR